MAALTTGQVSALAELVDKGEYDTEAERLFGLLVDIADAYTQALEAEGVPHAIDCALRGLRENLQDRLDAGTRIR